MVQVGFVQAAYTAMETDGQVLVCINISGAVLDRTVTVFVSTTSETASRESLLGLRWPHKYQDYRIVFLVYSS